jgi:hypothetical protein
MNTPNNEEEELSPEELLASFLKDDKLNDVTLKGNDGISVSANRYILAAKSRVFHRMFFGHFQEASSDEVDIGFPGQVIKAVVDHIHTKTPTILDHTNNNENENENENDS